MKRSYIKFRDNLPILIIILIGSVLRFYQFVRIPYTHDELSALFRTQFQSFSELVEKGILPDGHPAGIQVLLYILVHNFGSHEWVVKLPFLLFGVLSIGLVYYIAKNVFSITTALISASLVASLEYTIMYSQVARPYMSGMFFSLLLVHFWIHIIKNKNPQWLHYLGFIIAGALCLYNHYFSALFFILVVVSGVFLIKRKGLFYYAGSVLIVGLLFLPHLKITLAHLESGGVGDWLGPPNRNFIFHYFAYLLHYSIVLILLITSIWLGGWFLREKMFPKLNKWAAVFMAWFLITLIIGFFYSTRVEPVLQYSVLIFTFPFMVMAIFAHVNVHEFRTRLYMVILILSITIPTLILKRQYYHLFYQSRFTEIPGELLHDQLDSSNQEMMVLMGLPRKTLSYYMAFEATLDTTDIIWLEDLGHQKDLIRLLDTSRYEAIIYAHEPGDAPESYAIIKDYVPTLCRYEHYFLGSYYLFKKDTGYTSMVKDVIEAYGFESTESAWRLIDPARITDRISHSGHFAYGYDAGLEFGPEYTIKLTKSELRKSMVLDASLSAWVPEDFQDALLVCTIEEEGNILDWRSSSFNDYIVRHAAWNRVYFSFRFADIEFRSNDMELKLYIWNYKKDHFYVDDLEIQMRPGNPFLYGLYKPIAEY